MNGRTPELARTQSWILAGGQGERLQPLTASRPKPAVSFGAGSRIIDFTLLNCLYSGLGRVSLVTQYRYEVLHRYIREGWSELWHDAQGTDRTPLILLPPTCGKRYRGTADALFHNAELLRSDKAEFVLVLAGDHIYRMDYRGLLRQHAETSADLTIACVEHPVSGASHFGVVEIDPNFKVTGFEEKPANPRPLPSRPSMVLVSMGVYVFKKDVLLESLRCFCETGRGYDFGRDIIPSLIHSACTYAYDFRDEARNTPRYWRDIGTVDGYYEASMDLVDPDGPFDPYAKDCWPSQPAKYHREAKRCPDITRTVMSPGVHVEEGSIVADSILMPGVRIAKGVRLRRAIVEEGVHIPTGFQAGFDLEQDRRHHTVTAAGVVVVGKPPGNMKSAVVPFALRGTNAVA